MVLHFFNIKIWQKISKLNNPYISDMNFYQIFQIPNYIGKRYRITWISIWNGISFIFKCRTHSFILIWLCNWSMRQRRIVKPSYSWQNMLWMVISIQNMMRSILLTISKELLIVPNNRQQQQIVIELLRTLHLSSKFCSFLITSYVN